MNLKYQILRRLPPPLHFWLLKQSNRIKLSRVDTVPCDTSALIKGVTPELIRNLLVSSTYDAEWETLHAEIQTLKGAIGPSSVNYGENRALYILIRHFNAHSALEVGTHVGGSTVHMVAALKANSTPECAPRMVTVDIVDQNTPASLARRLGIATPLEKIKHFGASNWTQFVQQPSLGYLAETKEKFDFIFLDGDHAASVVYRELPAALERLNPGGVIMLHDYYPDGKALFSDHKITAGPWLAAKRLQREGAQFRIIPLGSLPWPTKLGSTTTVLAMVVHTSLQ